MKAEFKKLEMQIMALQQMEKVLPAKVDELSKKLKDALDRYKR